MARILTVATKKPAPYEEALKAVDLEPVYDVPLEEVDGLLLQGGTDVNPDLYGEEPIAETDEPDDERDEHELWLINDALERDIPILAICRGMQLLNVAHGGTLIQHIEGHKAVSHAIKITPGSKLAGLYEVTNSRHHQAVGKTGVGLTVAARAGRVVEAIERPDKKFVVGVQWHPEDMAQPDPVFQAFARAVQESSGKTSTPTSRS